MMHLMGKHPHSTFFNCSAPVYDNTLRKEVKGDRADISSGAAQLLPDQLDSNRGDFHDEKDEDSGIESTETDGKSDVQKEFSVMATTIRNNFYAFHQATEKYDSYNDMMFQSLRKNLTIKIPKILDHHSLIDYFERQLFKLAKNPRQMRKNWSEEENLLLISIVAYYCLLHSEDSCSLDDEAWKYIANIYPGKNAENLKARWQTIYKMTLNKAPWSTAEDELLSTIIKEKGPQHWKEIALELGKRSNYGIFRQGKQCRERWINHLDPHIKKGVWTEQEDVALLTLFLERGKKWAEIAKKLGGRTENNVKNRWISLMRKYKSEFSSEVGNEDFEADETSNWEEKIANAVIKLRGQEMSTKKPSDVHFNFNNSLHGSEISSQILSNDDDENFNTTKNFPEKVTVSNKRVEKVLPDLSANLPSKESLKQKLTKAPGAPNSFKNSVKEFYSEPNHTAATYLHHNDEFKKVPAFPHSGLPLGMLGNQPMLKVKIPHLLPQNTTMVSIHPQMIAYNPQVTFNKEFKEINPNIQQKIQSNIMYKAEELQAQNSENQLEEGELFHLTEKKMEKIPLEAQPDKDYLYFAVVDTKTHEIYIMNQVTQANYGQTLNALSSDKPDEFASNDMQAPAELALSQEPDFPDIAFSRKPSDFFFDDK